MSDLQKKINQSLVWAEHQARVDCELRGGDVSEHWASIISSQYEELVGKVEALTEINRLQSEENKQLAEDNAKLREALEKSTRAWDRYFATGEMFDYDDYESHEKLLESMK